MIRIRCFGSCVLRWMERIGEFSGARFHPIPRLYIYTSRVISRMRSRSVHQRSIFPRFACRPISRLDLLASPHFFFDRRIFNYSITFLSFFSEKKRKKTRWLLTLYGFVGTIFNIPPQEGVIASLNASRPGSTRRETKESDEFSSLSSLGSLF